MRWTDDLESAVGDAAGAMECYEGEVIVGEVLIKRIYLMVVVDLFDGGCGSGGGDWFGRPWDVATAKKKNRTI